MKKLLFLVLLFVSVSISYSQIPPECPLGWQQGSIQLAVGTNPACIYRIYFCFFCEGIFTGPEPSRVRITFELTAAVPQSNFCKKTSGEIYQALYNKMKEPGFKEQYLCIQSGPPPCINETWTLEVSVNKAVCWQKYHDPEFYDPEFTPETSIVYLVACPDNAKCSTLWKHCWDSDKQNWVTCIVETGITNGPPNCPPYDPEGDDPDDPLPYQLSECFQIMTPCNSPAEYEFCP